MHTINNNAPIYYQTKTNPAKTTSFKGHGGHEILEIGKDTLLLRHETAFLENIILSTKA